MRSFLTTLASLSIAANFLYGADAHNNPLALPSAAASAAEPPIIHMDTLHVESIRSELSSPQPDSPTRPPFRPSRRSRSSSRQLHAPLYAPLPPRNTQFSRDRSLDTMAATGRPLAYGENPLDTMAATLITAGDDHANHIIDSIKLHIEQTVAASKDATKKTIETCTSNTQIPTCSPCNHPLQTCCSWCTPIMLLCTCLMSAGALGLGFVHQFPELFGSE